MNKSTLFLAAATMASMAVAQDNSQFQSQSMKAANPVARQKHHTDNASSMKKAPAAFEKMVMQELNGSHVIDVAFEGDQMFITNISRDYPEAVITGKVLGDKVVLESDQYLGYLDKYDLPMYFTAASVDWNESMLYFEPEFVFNFDAANCVLTPAEEDRVLVINACPGSEEIYYYEIFIDPTIMPMVEQACIPATPEFYGASFDEEWGQFGFDFVTPNQGTNGEFINPDKMEWATYIDDELMTYSPEDGYEYLLEEMSWFPFDFCDEESWDFFSSGGEHIVYVFADLFETFAVQSRFTYEGVTYYSNIMSYNVMTGELEEIEVENPTPTGISALGAEKKVQNLFDLQGRKLNEAKGMTIKDGKVMFVK